MSEKIRILYICNCWNNKISTIGYAHACTSMGQSQLQLNDTDQCVYVLVLVSWRFTKGGLYSEHFTVTAHEHISENWVPITRSFPKLDCTIYNTRILFGPGIMAWAGERKRHTGHFVKEERSVSAYCHCTFCHTCITCLHLRHSKDCALWYILIIKANKMHSFSDLFDKVLYVLRTGPLSIIRSISTLYTCNRHLSC